MAPESVSGELDGVTLAGVAEEAQAEPEELLDQSEDDDEEWRAFRLAFGNRQPNL